jgi:hypothetical protein
MYSYVSASAVQDNFLDTFWAELTEAAYPVMLRHGTIDSWLELQLELWKVMRAILKKWDQEWPSAGVMLVGPSNLENEPALERC